MRLEGTQQENQRMVNGIEAQRAEIEGLVAGLEGVVRDIEGGIEAMNGNGMGELRGEAWEMERELMFTR